MPSQTGTATGMNDLFSQLSTFAIARGWAQDQFLLEAGATDAKLSLSKKGVFVHFAWNSGENQNIAVYQSLGFINAGTNLWQHTDDSGNGAASTPSATSAQWNQSAGTQRFIREVGVGPYTSYYFFAPDNAAALQYIHVALEVAPGLYRHFGFGELEKSWDWTGGEYAYGHDVAVVSSNTTNQLILLNAHSSTSTGLAHAGATIHAEGLPGATSGVKWGTFQGFDVSLGSSWRDRAGEFQLRFLGGAPSGPIGCVFNNLPSNAGDGFLPLTPNAVFYRNRETSPDQVFFMGFQPDVRTLNMRNFDPQATVIVDGDTWRIFPAIRKQNSDSGQESENMGIAYKEIP